MAFYPDLYLQFLFQQFKSRLEYRAGFIIVSIATMIQQGAMLLTIWAVMRQIPALNGWPLPAVMLIYGLMSLSRSLNQMFTDSTWQLGGYIRRGGFDRFLIRPINPLFHLFANQFNPDGVGNFLVGLMLVAAAGRSLGVFTSAYAVLYAVVAVVSGGVIFTAISLIAATSAFWLADATAVSAAVFENHRFAYFPLNIYPRGFIFALTWVIPYGFASFYPAAFLLGRDVGMLAWLGPVVAIVLAVISYRVWLFGMRHYSGTGT